MLELLELVSGACEEHTRVGSARKENHGQQRAIARPPLQGALLLVCALSPQLAGCLTSDCDEVVCCRSCDEDQVRSACECGEGEQPVYLCPKRSACALAYHVGEGPATCCKGSCQAESAYEAEDGRCAADERYLHECAVESPCFQGIVARRSGTTFLPWREEAPRSGTPLFGIWASGPNDVWAVGMFGTILRRDEAGWTTQESPTSENLSGIWGSGPRDIWAVGGGGAVVHFDGTSWSAAKSATSEPLSAVWGTDKDQVWAVGRSGTIVRWDGKTWALEASAAAEGAPLTDVAGRSEGDVWATGADGVVLHRRSGKWVREETPTRALVASVWATADEVWIAGSNGLLLTRTRDGWAGTPSLFPVHLAGLWGKGREVWAVGENGIVLRRLGAEWQRISYFASYPYDLRAVWGVDGRVWAVSLEGAILGYDPLPSHSP